MLVWVHTVRDVEGISMGEMVQHTLTMMLVNSQKEDVTINKAAKWEFSAQTHKLSCDSSWGRTSAWEIKYPGSRCSYNQCYSQHFASLPATGTAFKNKARRMSNLTWTKLRWTPSSV